MSLWMQITGHFCAVGSGKVHAAKARLHNPTKRKTYDALCGARCKPLAFPTTSEGQMVTVSWPPFVKDAAEWGYTRCADCMKAAPGRPAPLPLAATS